MGKWNVERLAAASGIGFVIFVVIGSLIPGSPAKYDASAAEIASYFHDKHKALLVGGILYGVAYVLFLWFLASFAGTFREAGQQRLATIMYGAGVATVTIGAIADGMNVSLARIVALGVDDNTVKALYGVDNFLYGRLFWTATAFALATMIATRRSKALPEWHAWLSLVASVVLVLGGVSMKTTGFFSPSGAMPMIAFFALLVWILVSSVLLVQRTAPATSPM